MQLAGKISFRESCPHCGRDAHICMNCTFYDRSSYNECRESAADRVVEKERNNYCEYFALIQAKGGTLSGEDPSRLAKEKLAALFAKK